MKIFASHSDILDNIGNEAKEAESKAHLETIATKLRHFGGHILEITRFNVAVEIAEHRLHELADIVIDDVEGFLGHVQVKLHELKDHIDHIEVCPPGPTQGS